MSHMVDISNPSQDKENPSRVASECLVVGQSAKKLKYNEHGMPIGGKTKQATRIRDLARTFIQIYYGDWPSVDIRYKDQVWDTMMDKIKKLLEVFKDKGEEETVDNGPLYEVFGKETRGRVRCVGPAISRKAMLASAFAHDMLTEVNTNGDDMKVKVDVIQEEIGGLKSMVYDFINDLKNGKFSINHDNNIPPNSVPVSTRTSFPATSPTSFPTLAPTRVANAFTSRFTSLGELTECKILSFTKELLGLGRKGKVGDTTVVHGHTLGPREVRVILDIIKMPDAPIWDGKQNNCTKLSDVGTCGFMYWHNDLCPPDY